MITFKIAFRNIFRQRRRSTLTALTMLGGFVLSSFSIAWQDGSYSHVIDLFTRTQTGHVQVHHKNYLRLPSLYRTIDDYEAVGAEISGVEGVEGWAPRLLAAGLASVGDRSTAVRIIGIDPVRETAMTRFNEKVSAGNPLDAEPDGGALLGVSLAKRLGAAPGDSLVILSQAADGSMANDVYTVRGIVTSGDPASDQTSLYLHVADAQSFFVLEGRVHEIAVVASSVREADQVAARIEARLADRPELSAVTWKVFAASFYEAMKADQRGNWISLFVIILVVSVGVLNTILMSVLERTREYGLLRAVGTRPRSIFGLVLSEVFLMSVLSVVLGAIVAYFINSHFSVHGISLPDPVTFAGIEWRVMYSEINVRSFVMPAAAVWLSALFVAVFPAVKAARTMPAAAMRTH